MVKDSEYYQQLLKQYLDNNCGPQEAEELLDFLNRNESGRVLMAQLQAEFRQSMEQSTVMPSDISEKIRNRLQAQIGQRPVISFYKRYRFRIAAAAAILVILATAGYFLFPGMPAKQHAMVITEHPNDIKPPETNRATITLANGEAIYLDSAANGTLIHRDNVQVIKMEDGRIVYKGSSEDMVFNTLTNPRGSQVIDMTLSDGSRVWLNAGSSVTYPMSFSGTNREVTITGEAYFEVAPNPQKPFKVGTGKTYVAVLGTHFNVNAFEDEEDIRVTLLEGSVLVNNESARGILKPGQQARVNAGINIVDDVNTAQVMAWKNGKFDFADGVPLTTIMRQVSRWYDVEVEYRAKIHQEFVGSISRQVNVSKLLEKFELTGRVHFKIEGRKIIVSP